MSEHHSTAVVLTASPLDIAVDILGQSLERLVDDYDFGFRGYGVAMQLFFENGRYDEDVIDEPFKQRDFDCATVARLARVYRWFALQGSIRVPGVDRLCSLDVVLCPSPVASKPACVLFRLDSWFLERVYGRSFDAFDSDAADALVQLSIVLGANEKADGFTTIRAPSLANIPALDAPTLRTRLLHPEPAPAALFEAMAAPGVGFVTGVKSTLVSRAELQLVWSGAVVLETTTGFSVLSTMTEPPDV